ncbi:hypothetical protein EDD85DRAFT_786418 [Armillaria nabsnona]|nr:hypothetical protein EDD85DRAFT_786418 [Armillaria nabsnona]
MPVCETAYLVWQLRIVLGQASPTYTSARGPPPDLVVDIFFISVPPAISILFHYHLLIANVGIYDANETIKIDNAMVHTLRLKLELGLSNSYAGLRFRIDSMGGDHEKTWLEYLGEDSARVVRRPEEKQIGGPAYPPQNLATLSRTEIFAVVIPMEMPKETVARARTESRIDYLVISPDIQYYSNLLPFHQGSHGRIKDYAGLQRTSAVTLSGGSCVLFSFLLMLLEPIAERHCKGQSWLKDTGTEQHTPIVYFSFCRLFTAVIDTKDQGISTRADFEYGVTSAFRDEYLPQLPLTVLGYEHVDKANACLSSFPVI